MPKPVEKKAFLFYATTLDLLEELPPERQGKVALALIEYGLDEYNYFAEFSGSLSILDPVERVIFRSVIYEIAVQKRRYHNKYLIRGAIETVQNTIATSQTLDDKLKEHYVEIIRVLEERYLYAMKHDVRDVSEKLSIFLPDNIDELFRKRYEYKSWRTHLTVALENRLKSESRNLTDEVKKKLLEQIMTDFVNSGNAFGRYEELLKEYTEDSEKGGGNSEA